MVSISQSNGARIYKTSDDIPEISIDDAEIYPSPSESNTPNISSSIFLTFIEYISLDLSDDFAIEFNIDYLCCSYK